MIGGVAEQYRKHLRDRITELAQATGYGNASTWEAYREQVGKVKGLEMALADFNELVKRYLDEE